ncbi:MAG: MBL fold metallo-hydrolase [Elusimicrobia bacterium]|nr:MBL fold metallo-hydrolase [Elusimicrobiota bacterium]
MKIGRFEIFQLNDGFFRLDGGAMHGAVPKTLWCRHHPADDKNRIKLALGSLLIKTPSGKWVLADTGLSSKYEHDVKFKSIYALEREQTLLDGLKNFHLTPMDISVVINTHLHFDHCGGNTVWEEASKPRPAFARAKYIVQKEEWDDANHPHERSRASYLEENFACLETGGQLELVLGNYEIEPGLSVIQSGGHTRGHQCVVVESKGQGAIFFGDLIPTRAHVALPWIMGYDLYPVATLESKRKLLKVAQEREWLAVFQHDPLQRAGFIREVDGRILAVPPENDK